MIAVGEGNLLWGKVICCGERKFVVGGGSFAVGKGS